MGNRVRQARSVGYHGERDDVLSGYIILTAADFDAAVAIAHDDLAAACGQTILGVGAT
jgi:hypothetical protein